MGKDYPDILVKDSKIVKKKEHIRNENYLIHYPTGKVAPERCFKDAYESILPSARKEQWGGDSFWDIHLHEAIQKDNEWTIKNYFDKKVSSFISLTPSIIGPNYD